MLILLSGCSGVGPDLDTITAEKLFHRDNDSEIRKAAMEDQSFPRASESVPLTD